LLPFADLAIDLASLLVGIGLGLAGWFWQWWHLQQQAKAMLTTVSEDAQDVSLSLLSLLRRGIAQARHQQQVLATDLQVWQRVVDEVPVGVLWVDRDDFVRVCNGQARSLLGLTAWNDQQDRLLIEMVRSYDLDYLVSRARLTGQPQSREMELYRTVTLLDPQDRHPGYPNHAPGRSPSVASHKPMMSPPPLFLQARSLPLDNGEVVVFLEDRRELVELSRKCDRWASDLAHELRTPLTSIQLVVETLQSQLVPPQRTWVDRLMPEVDRLVTFVRDWLDLSQMEQQSEAHHDQEPVELRSLLVAVWQSLTPLVETTAIQFHIQGLEAAIVQGDSGRLHRLFLNLLDNAIVYSPPAGEIVAQLRLLPAADVSGQGLVPCTPDFQNTVDHWIQVDIVDQGPGLDPEDLPHIFDRFYRGDPSRVRTNQAATSGRSRSQGSGLGLAIARQIAIAHHGYIHASNDPETGGARFRVILPSAS
jgi:two-component system phosphate regulon sensor histidine kinase PhoR